MFIGQYRNTFDAKGRVVIPSSFRKALGTDVIINKGIEECITLYTTTDWEALVNKVSELPFTRSENRLFMRYFTSSAFQKEIDGQGRINIDSVLLEHAKITKDCVIVGCGKTIEIWSKEKWDEIEAGRYRLDEISEKLEF